MVAVKTGFSSPSMPGMPAPMQPMGGLPPMPPMGGPGTFPVPQGGNPFAPMPPMPLAGSPTPPAQPPMAQSQQQNQRMQVSGANRRRRFGDSLETMLGRNQGIGSVPQQRPLPMPQQQQRMVAPGTPMMRTPTPRPMQMGGEVDIFGYEDGGIVPRQTSIGDQPHMLAYINQDEEALLRSFGGSGLPGPGGIPTYRPSDYAAERAASSVGGGRGTVVESAGERAAAIARDMASRDDNDNKRSSTGPSGYTSLDTIAAAATADDDKPSNVTLAPTGTVDFTLPPTSSDDKPPVIASIDFGDDDGGSVIKDVTYYDDTGTDEIAAPIFDVEPVYVDPTPPPPPPVYTDIYGVQHSSQAEADAANRAIAAQATSYGLGQQGFNRFAATARDSGFFDTPEQANQAAARAYPTYLENYNEGRALRDFDEAPFTYTGIGGIGGSGDATSGGTGMTPAPITPPQLPSDESGFSLSDADKALSEVGAPPVIDLGTSVFLDPDAGDPRGDQIVSPTGTGIGRESDLQRGLGATDRQTYYGGSGSRDERDMYQAPEESIIAKTVAGFEGRAETPYWDVNAHRAGYGSDTKTDPETGKVTKITSDTTVSREEADADLNRRLTTEFIPRIVNTVGADTFYSMNPEQQAALTSITYNYGKLPDRVASVINNVDPSTSEGQKAISDAIRSLEGDNDGVNRDRRNSEANLFLGQGNVPETSVVEKPDTGVTPEQREKNAEKIKAQIGDQAEPTGVENVFYNIIGGLGFGLGKGFADDLRDKSREERQAIIDQHVYALENGATPRTDEEGNYIGFDISTMDTFADKVLAADDISVFLPGGAEDADGDGVSDYDRFRQVYDAQSEAAKKDPYGMSTEQGFITEDGREFFVDAGGNVVEVTDGVVPFEVGGGDDVTDIFTATTTTTSDDDDDTTTTDDDTNYTTDKDGNIVCNNPDYVYNPETEKCEPKKVEEDDGDLGSPISTGIAPRSFDEVLRSVVVPAPDIPSISTNIRPMQSGGMAGLNRAADNFLKALAG